VARAVHAHAVAAADAEAAHALHDVLEGPDGGLARDQADDVLRARVARRELVGDVAPQAARVGAVAVGARVARGGGVCVAGAGISMGGSERVLTP
jgi:hypothetical protein